MASPRTMIATTLAFATVLSGSAMIATAAAKQATHRPAAVAAKSEAAAPRRG